jgi:hypothetical protein
MAVYMQKTIKIILNKMVNYDVWEESSYTEDGPFSGRTVNKAKG